MPLRRLCLSALLLLLLPASAVAQRDPRVVGLQLGFARASLESFSLTGDNTTITLPDSRDGAHVGVYYRQRIFPVVWLQPELNIVLKGGQESRPEGSANLELGYLELPLMVRIAPKYRRKSLRPVLFAGPSVGFRISCAITGVSTDTTLTRACEDGSSGSGIEDAFTSAEASAIVGGGIELDRAGIAIAIEARYSWGLTDVISNGGGGRNRFFALLFTLSL